MRGRRDRVARPEEARALIAAVPHGDRALWATALYAGLRRGELQALRWEDVDLEDGLVRVERSWDPKEGPVEPKSRAGRRRVPLVKPLRAGLAAHRLRQGGGEGLVLGGGDTPFASGAATRRAREAWAAEALEPIGLHECRHTYAAFMIAGRQRQGALDLHGPLLDHDQPRPLRPPHAGLRGRGGGATRGLPRAGGGRMSRLDDDLS